VRVCVFIDGSNFYKACQRNLGRTDVNLTAFAALLVGPSRDLIRTYYYMSPLPADADSELRAGQQRFINRLNRLPYLEVRYGKLVRRDEECKKCGDKRQRWQEKGVDMRIGVDMLALASKDNYDVAVLVTGDGDLREAVQAVKDLGKHVEVATFRIGRSDELVQVCDVITELTVADMTPLYFKTA
jgi:uncharacterized LabA/DUF88 family protein